MQTLRQIQVDLAASKSSVSVYDAADGRLNSKTSGGWDAGRRSSGAWEPRVSTSSDAPARGNPDTMMRRHSRDSGFGSSARSSRTSITSTSSIAFAKISSPARRESQPAAFPASDPAALTTPRLSVFIPIPRIKGVANINLTLSPTTTSIETEARLAILNAALGESVNKLPSLLESRQRLLDLEAWSDVGGRFNLRDTDDASSMGGKPSKTAKHTGGGAGGGLWSTREVSAPESSLNNSDTEEPAE
ncbi:hypothetical protein DFS34DRAFT_420404 [Phlyctochytrium arcticum]|nr:hypothetical protein DFS34DRAFT_420404 [Phlyctochytrium arcticum]